LSHRAAVSKIQLATCDSAKDIEHIKSVFDIARKERDMVAVKKWLHPDGIDSEASFVASLRMKHPETGKWLFDLNDFASWESSTGRCIWLHGIAGCGKSVLS
jgi:hypothetical protein